MRRPPRPVRVPKVPLRTHERKASMRMILVASAIAALILSGNLQRAQAESVEVASVAVPLQLRGWAAPGALSCEESWARVEIPLNDCLYDWWLMEPERAEVALDWRAGGVGGSTLGLSDLPPRAVQVCLERALSQAASGQSCAVHQRVSLPPE